MKIGKWRRPGDPTPAEIAAQTALIRETWSEWTCRKRAGMAVEPHWLPPTAILRTSSSPPDD